MALVLVVGAGSFDSGGVFDEADPLAPPSNLEELPSVSPAVNGLVAQMAKTAGLRVMGGDAALDPDLEALNRLWLDAHREAAAGTTSDALIVHFAGHGVPGTGHHSLFLPTRQTTPANLPWTAPQVGSWLEQAECVADGPPVLLLLDVCGAGRPVMQQLVDGIRAADRRAWVIAACAPDEKTYQARFTWAVGLVLERLREGRLDISPTVEYVPVETLAREIDRELVRSAVAEDRPSQSVLRTVHAEARLRVPPFLPNPSYRETPGGQFRRSVETGLWQFAAAVDPALDPMHFISRASGTPQRQDMAQACFFTGREEQLGRIKQWLEEPDQPSLMVVTGSPGSGKSALLGVAACLAHPQLREVTRQIAQAVPRDVRPEPNPGLAAVHARQRGPSEVLSSVASQLGLGDEPGRGWTATALLDRIASQRSQPVTIVVDALDEASLDTALLWDILIPLAQARRRREDREAGMEPVLCRVLIGTRPWWDRYSALLGALDGEEQRIDLDEISVEQRTDELADYLCDILETSQAYSGLGTSALRRTTAHAVAEELAARHDSGGFLLASLFAHYLIHQDEAPTVEQVVRRIPWDLPGMLDLHLEVLEREHPAMRTVLAAVAHGYGQGMPLEVVHQVAAAFTAPQDEAPDTSDTRRALQAAAFYLRFSTDTDGQRLYRFYHQSLVDHLRSEYDYVRREAISERVLDTVPGPASIAARRFGLAQPYVLRHAVQHAADAGRSEELLRSASFLVHCDPQLLHEHLSTTSLRGQILGLISQAALSPVHEPWQRREWLRSTAEIWGEAWLVEAVDALDESTLQPTRTNALSPVWGTAEDRARSGEWFSGGDTVLVRCAERWLAVCNDFDGPLTVWDVRMGLPLFSLRLPEAGPVTALCGRQVRAGSLVAVGTTEGDVHVWDLDTGNTLARIRTDALPVVALGLVEQGGRTLIIVCGGGEVTAYDLSGDRVSSLDVVGGWLSGLEADGTVDDLYEPDLDIEGYDCTAVGAMVLDGKEVFAAGAADGSVHLWEADGRGHRTWPGGGSPVSGLHILEGPGGPFLGTTSEEGSRTWNVRTGEHRQLPGVSPYSVGTVVLDDNAKPCWAYLAAGEEILLHPLDDEASADGRLCDVPRSLTGLAVIAADHSSLAAVGVLRSQTDSRSLRSVKLLVEGGHDGRRSLLWRSNHSSGVEHAAVSGTGGRVSAISADDLGDFHVWDTFTGATSFAGHYGGITALATGALAGADVVVIAQREGVRSLVHVMHPDGKKVCPPLELPDTALKLAIGDIGGVSALIVHTVAGIFRLTPGDPGPPLRLYGREAGGHLIEGFALGRRRDEDVIVVVHEWYTRGSGDGGLVVQALASAEPPVKIGLGADFNCLATGRWEELDAVAVGHLDGTVVVVCLATGNDLALFQAHEGPVATVAFIRHQDTSRLVTSGEMDNTVRLWDPRSPGELLAETSFPDSLGAVGVSDAGVLAGFGTRVAFLSWISLDRPSNISERTENP